MQRRGLWAAVAGVAMAVAGGFYAAAGPMPPGAAPPADPTQAAKQAAPRHLRLAREHLAAPCEMLKKCDRHAVDG